MPQKDACASDIDLETVQTLIRLLLLSYLGLHCLPIRKPREIIVFMFCAQNNLTIWFAKISGTIVPQINIVYDGYPAVYTYHKLDTDLKSADLEIVV